MNILGKLNLLDSAGNLSITNIGAFAAIGMSIYGVLHGIPTEQLIAIIGLLVNYMSKRHMAIKQVEVKEEVPATSVDHDTIEALRNELEMLKSSLSFLKKGSK